MKNRTQQPTRKKLALRRWILVLALFSVGYFLMPATFSPTQAIRYYERANAIDRTAVVQWKKAGPRLFCLSENEDVLLLTGHQYAFPYGWMDFGAFPLDLTKEDGPTAALSVSCSLQDKDWRHLMIFGVVRQEEAAAVRVRDAQVRTGERDSYQPGSQVWTEEILTGKDGLRYFWFGQNLESPLISLHFDTLEVLDEAGRVLCTYDLSEQYNSVSG